MTGHDIFDDALSGFGVIACGVATLPASIGPFADAALTVGTFLSHTESLLSW